MAELLIILVVGEDLLLDRSLLDLGGAFGELEPSSKNKYIHEIFYIIKFHKIWYKCQS